MADRIQEQKELYKNHLEFLGYQVKDDEDNAQDIVATRDNTWTFLRIFNNGLRAYRVYTTSAKAQNERLAFLEFISSANDRRIAKMYAGNDWLLLELWYLCAYEKLSFGQFMNTLQDEASAFTKEFGEAGFWA